MFHFLTFFFLLGLSLYSVRSKWLLQENEINLSLEYSTQTFFLMEIHKLKNNFHQLNFSLISLKSEWLSSDAFKNRMLS